MDLSSKQAARWALNAAKKQNSALGNCGENCKDNCVGCNPLGDCASYILPVSSFGALDLGSIPWGWVLGTAAITAAVTWQVKPKVVALLRKKRKKRKKKEKKEKKGGGFSPLRDRELLTQLLRAGLRFLRDLL